MPLLLPLLVAGLASAQLSIALPLSGQQVVLSVDKPARHPLAIVNELDPLRHLSAISPYQFNEPAPVPDGCAVTRAALLVRHSAIMGNDDEWADYMHPFTEKLKTLPDDAFPDPDDTEHPWQFLRSYKSPLKERNLEKLAPRGEEDAKKYGEVVREQYKGLFPPKEIGRKHKKGDNGDEKAPKIPYKVWTASSERDITSAKSFINGAFPKHQSGDDGTGDGEVVQLIEVPNKAKEGWDRSLTPHKVCDAFEKESSKGPADQWLSVFGKRIRTRLADGVLPGVGWLENGDILGMMMLCGYESIVKGDSPFCHVFTDDEWLDFEYREDIRFSYMMGYHSPLTPYLGMPWVSTAAHLLAGAEADEDEAANLADLTKGKKERPLPKPKLPPNGTHTQRLHTFFTHRESPSFVSVALNLYNVTTPSGEPPSSAPPPLDYRPVGRSWKTSELVPFLGTVALERLSCAAPSASSHRKGEDEDEDESEFVRAVVNGKAESMHGCQGGPGDSCPFAEFQAWVEDRKQRWSAWEAVCEVPKDE